LDKVAHLLSDLWSLPRNQHGFSDKVNLQKVVDEAIALVKTRFGKKRKYPWKTRSQNPIPNSKVDRKKSNRLFELLLKGRSGALLPRREVKFTAQAIGSRGPSEVQIEMEDNGTGLSQAPFNHF